MLHNKRKHHKNKMPFKSHTDVNNYNNFLLDLDKKNKEKRIINDHNTLDNNSSKKYCKDDIKIFVKDSNNEFVKLGYDKRNFTGLSPWETFIAAIEKHLEPNLYINNGDNVKKENEMEREKENINPITGNVTVPKLVPKNKVNITIEINNIKDLLNLIDTYPDDKNTEYNIDMNTLHKIKQPLTELNNMIGMKELKENIVDQIIFYIQHLHTSNDFMHTVIYGPPGTGKTEVAKIIGSIFSKIGILKKGTFKKVTRADLVAGYLGQTALKTRDVIKECLGGVLFIDEAYALGNDEKKDSFSKECIDTLCEALSDYKDEFMVIIAGYESDLNSCFFNYNQGLNSRFTWRVKTGEYTAEDLFNIFIKKVTDGEWALAENTQINVKWFEKHKAHFKFYGRDIETLFAKTKIAHSRRVFGLDPLEKKMITLNDLENGLKIYLKNEDSANKEIERHNKIISSMYL